MPRIGLAVVILALPTLACSTMPETYSRHALMDQVLRVRDGFKGLTHRVCNAYSAKGECIDYEIIEHRLEDAVFREQANAENFICTIGGQRFRICKDQPGFCRITTKGLLYKGNRKDYLPGDDLAYLKTNNARCMSRENYPN